MELVELQSKFIRFQSFSFITMITYILTGVSDLDFYKFQKADISYATRPNASAFPAIPLNITELPEPFIEI